MFLMGVYDASCDKFRTVAKCGNGHDDATILKLQDELDMVKIAKVSRGSVQCKWYLYTSVCFLGPDRSFGKHYHLVLFHLMSPQILEHRIAQT